jgi:hypothetical protein
VVTELVSERSVMVRYSLAGAGQKFIRRSIRQLCIVQSSDEWELLGLEPEVL